MPKSVQVCSTKASVSRNVSLSRRRAIRSRAVNFPCSWGRRSAHASGSLGPVGVLFCAACRCDSGRRPAARRRASPRSAGASSRSAHRSSSGGVWAWRISGGGGGGYCLLGARIDRVVEAERSETGTRESLHGNPHRVAVIASDARPREPMVTADGGPGALANHCRILRVLLAG